MVLTPPQDKRPSQARRLTRAALLTAIALTIFLAEAQLPPPVPIPGIKLGLANLVVVAALYLLRPGEALAIGCLRILLVGLPFGSPATMLYSLSGGLLSFGMMVLCRRSGRFSVAGGSMAGGVSHNIGQLAAAAALTATPQLVWYLPVLLFSGLATGLLIGLAARLVLPPLRRLPLG